MITHTPTEVLASLPVRQRSTLAVRDGLLLDVDPEHGNAILGAVRQDEQGVYLSCTSCELEIEESDGGMCPACRSDLAYEESIGGDS